MYADELRRLAQHNRPVRGYLCLRVRDFESSVLSGARGQFRMCGIVDTCQIEIDLESI